MARSRSRARFYLNKMYIEKVVQYLSVYLKQKVEWQQFLDEHIEVAVVANYSGNWDAHFVFHPDGITYSSCFSEKMNLHILTYLEKCYNI